MTKIRRVCMKFHKKSLTKRPKRSFSFGFLKGKKWSLLGVSLGVITLTLAAQQWSTRSQTAQTPAELSAVYNFLLLGVAGNADHGGDLTDSVMIVSVNTENKVTSLLSLPRDLFIKAPLGDRKLNEIYASARHYFKNNQQGLATIETAVSDFLGIEIHYAAVVDFRTFTELIDEIGGLEIFIPYEIIDPFFPKGDYDYQTFVIRKGWQKLSGEQTLQYVRTRKTSSDYARAERQQDVLLALQKKALNSPQLLDPQFIGNLYQIFREHIVTDINLSEAWKLLTILPSLSSDRLVTAVLHDDPTRSGGLLFTPAQEFYGGQFVLLPDDLNMVEAFSDLTLKSAAVLLEKAQISVLNGGNISGAAYDLSVRLRQLGLVVINTGNFSSPEPVAKSFIRVRSNTTPHTVAWLKNTFGPLDIVVDQPTTEQNSDSLVDIEFILGSDAQTLWNPNLTPRPWLSNQTDSSAENPTTEENEEETDTAAEVNPARTAPTE